MDPTVTPLFGVPNAAQQAASSKPAAEPINPPQLPPMRKPKRHGIVDDTLGFLGDFLLSRLRMGTPYRDAKRNEKLQIASEGFEQNPAEGFRRLAEVDYNAATKLRDQYIDNERLAASQASTAEARDARIAAAQTVQNDRTRNRVGAMLDTMGTWDEKKRTDNWSSMRDQVLKYSKTQGLDLSGELPETFDPVSLDAFIDGSVPTSTQRSQRLLKARDSATDVDRDASRAERVRHNTRTEQQGDERLKISASKAAVSASRGGGGSRRPARATNIQTYTGEDGYKYTQRSDGTTVKSPIKVRAYSSGSKLPEGTRRVVNGKTYELRNGKPVRVD